jgi:hypothetical protein
MLRRVAIILGLAWAVLLASLVVSEMSSCLRQRSWPAWDASKALLLLQALLYGTMAFVCFALSVALNGKGKAADPAEDPEDPRPR